MAATARQDTTSHPRAASGGAQVRRLPRAERREQILDAATRALARAGFTRTGLDDVAEEAGVTRVILYRHFESKQDMYRAVLDRACNRLVDSVGEDDFDEQSIPALLRAASADPDGFRLLFRHAVREPEFRDMTDAFAAASTDVAHRHLARIIDDEKWAAWAAHVVPTVTIEAVIAWLDAGEPDPHHVAERIGRAVQGVIEAAQADLG